MATNNTRTEMLAQLPARAARAGTTLITQRATFTVYSVTDHSVLGRVRATCAEAACAAWQHEHGTHPVHIDEED